MISLFGYSGHAFVVIEIFKAAGLEIGGYFMQQPASNNPYHLNYLGFEANKEELLAQKGKPYHIAVGDNVIRRKIATSVAEVLEYAAIAAIHPTALVSPTATIESGSMIGPRTVINAYAQIGEGVICNTGSIIEHECQIESFAHIAPGAVLCGNVSVGANTLVGARAVVLPNLTIGKNVVIGAGAVVTRDIPDHTKVVGNPQKIINGAS